MESSPLFETPCRILIADDEAIARKQIKRLLEEELNQHQVQVDIEVVGTIEAAKRKLKDDVDRPFDVLILDWKFNKRPSGTSLLQWLKDEKQNAIDTEVIMLTAHQTTVLQEKVLELGAYFYADKGSVLRPDTLPEPDANGIQVRNSFS